MKITIIKYLSLIVLLACAVVLSRNQSWGPIVGFLGALIAFIKADLTPIVSSEHDKKLYQKFINEFPSNGQALQFLKNHDVGNPFQLEELADLYQFLNAWNNAEHEFRDKKLERLRLKLFTSATQFRSELALNIWSSKNGYFTMGMDDAERRPEMLKKRDYLNKLANEVYGEHQRLVRTGKKYT